MALAIAVRYASALAEVLEKPSAQTTLAVALEQMRAIEAMLGSSADLRRVLAAPSIPIAQKRALVEKLGESAGVSRPVRNLLFVMLDNRRTALLGEVISAFSDLLDEKTGVERIEVTSALAMDARQRIEVVEKFSRMSGKKVEAVFATDEKLLGGAVVRRGNTLFDGSLASQLKALDRAMAGEV